MFGKYDFETMNETDVREGLVAPLLRKLGYMHGSMNNITTEQSLRYPKIYIGRKKEKDQDIRGKADYILDVDKRLRWVIEVKAPGKEISIDDIEQAYSYAVHPEVRAIYFMVTNGKMFRIFQTVNGPEAPHLFETTYEELERNYLTLSNILSPQALQKNHKRFVLDTGKPLGPGLRSFAKITYGKISYSDNSSGIPYIRGMNIFISEGAIQRTDEGGILVYIKTEPMFQQLKELNDQFGREILEASSDSEIISSDPQNPSVFKGSSSFTIPLGTSLFNFTTGRYILSKRAMFVRNETLAEGILTNNRFWGNFKVSTTFSCSYLNTVGDFEVILE